MAIPSIVRWDDVGAPTLNNAASSLLAVLDFALLPKGWTKEFSNTDIAVYRAPLGSRKFYRILDNNSQSTDNILSPTITAYDTMSDASTGSGWGVVAYLRKSETTSTAKRWVVLVDSYGFWLVTQPGGSIAASVDGYPMVPHYIGDDVPLLPGETPRAVINACVLMSYASNAAITTPDYYYSPAGNNIFVNRSNDGTSLNIKTVALARDFQTGADYTGNKPAGCCTSAPFNYPYNGSLICGKPYITNGPNLTSIGSYIPFVYYTPQKGGGFSSLQVYTDSDKQFMALRISNAATTSVRAAYSTSSANYGVLLLCINEER